MLPDHLGRHSVQVHLTKILSNSGPDELLVKLNVTGICFTDIHYAMGDMAFPKMQEFGVRSPGQ
jgi:D-arabinose 1-dehydrogenase-like Zn-dependent alcohol dehydrogenase